MSFVVLASLTPTQSFAAAYGDFLGPIRPNVPGRERDFLDVSDEGGLYGAPRPGLQNLWFQPEEFEAFCSQCPAGRSIADILSLEIRHGSSNPFPYGFDVSAAFDYTLQSFDSAGAAEVSFEANLRVEILELDGLAVAGVSEDIPLMFSTGRSGGQANNRAGSFHIRAEGIAIETGIGQAYALADLSGLLFDAGLSGVPTRTRMALEMTVVAGHEGVAGQGLGHLREVDVSILTGIRRLDGEPAFQTRAILPEPSTALLMMLGLSWMSARPQVARSPQLLNFRGAGR